MSSLTDLLDLVDELFGDDPEPDDLVDVLQELETEELKVICENAWALELLLAYCKARK